MKSWFEPAVESASPATFVPYADVAARAATENAPQLLAVEEVEAREAAAYQRGLAEGREERPAFDLADLQRAAATLEAAATAYGRGREEEAEGLHQMLVEVALELSERIVKARIPLDTDALVVRVSSALEALGQTEGSSLRLSEADLQVLRAGDSEAFAALSAQPGVEMTGDASLALGEFALERGATVVDGTCAAMLARLRESLADWTLTGGEASPEVAS